MDLPQKEIVFVCTGNTCRSPMAEGLFRHALAGRREPLSSLTVSSAGLAAPRGNPPSENSVLALKKVGIDISGHRSQPLSQEQMDNALAFFCMTSSHLAALAELVDPAARRVYLMRQFLSEEADLEIPDPYGGPLSSYEACRDSMVEAVPSLLEAVGKWIQEGGESSDKQKRD